MSNSSTKPQGATSYKETAFGIIPRTKLLQLEIEGTKKGLEYIDKTISKDKDIPVTSELICKLHDVSLFGFFQSGQGNIERFK